ncbi:hypothetical protein [Nocardioides sp.]|uniref:hypothetical protein n=1 Tax=Nocardioides sp. TaxID=35761 RepID=UPI0035198032
MPDDPRDTPPSSGAGDAPEPVRLDPATEDAVRRTLAASGGPETTPPEVVARLDDTIAALTAERSAESVARPSDPEAVVLDLDDAARARRTRLRWLLGAAAAVVVIGIGGGLLGDGAGTGNDASTASDSSDSAPQRAESAQEPPANLGSLREDADSAGGVTDTTKDLRESAAASSSPDRQLAGAPRRVDDGSPLRDVRADRLRADLVALRGVLPQAPADYRGITLLAPADFVCEPGGFGAGRLVGVRYDGVPAVVAFRAPVGSTQVAEVLACGTGDVLRSTTLPRTGG